jgi:DNA/RNA endonuclease G (NUC1)
MPSTENVITTPAYVCSMNYRFRVPNWVAEHLTMENVQGRQASRAQANFYSDPAVPLLFRSINADYWDSGWSRGHMAPASCHTESQDAMNSTFALSNIVPQDLSQNGCDWARLETFVKKLVTKDGFTDVYTISGPLWLPCDNVPLPPEAKYSAVPWKMLQFPIIGETGVAVPTHLFKVVVAEKAGEQPLVGAFVMPNRPLLDFKPLAEYQAEIEDIESQSGLQIFNKLNRQQTLDLCQKTGCRTSEWALQKYWRHYGRLQSAKSQREVDALWKVAEEQGYSNNAVLRKLYRQRKGIDKSTSADDMNPATCPDSGG